MNRTVEIMQNCICGAHPEMTVCNGRYNPLPGRQYGRYTVQCQCGRTARGKTRGQAVARWNAAKHETIRLLSEKYRAGDVVWGATNRGDPL